MLQRPTEIVADVVTRDASSPIRTTAIVIVGRLAWPLGLVAAVALFLAVAILLWGRGYGDVVAVAALVAIVAIASR